MKKALIPALLALAVAACNGDAKKDEGAGKASGEVLPGSASDAMIPNSATTTNNSMRVRPRDDGRRPDMATKAITCSSKRCCGSRLKASNSISNQELSTWLLV